MEAGIAVRLRVRRESREVWAPVGVKSEELGEMIDRNRYTKRR